jgi:cytochrome c oxidase subunit 2
MDVVPGKYSSIWFEPTKPGRYQLFCAEYCGTSHSGMIGWINVMGPSDYQAWLSGAAGEGSLAQTGQKLFQDLACISCHKPDGQGRGPRLEGLYGSQVTLQDGQKLTADESYIRESILNPKAKLVSGYQPIMPTFQGLVSEEQLLQLIAYVRSLSPQGAGSSSSAPPSNGAPSSGQANPAASQPQTNERQGNSSATPDAPRSNPTATRPQGGAQKPPQ